MSGQLAESGIISITNDGQKLSSTNYWDLPQAKAGRILLTHVRGALRVLVPNAFLKRQPTFVEEVSKARLVVLSRGPWPSAPGGGLKDAYELLFEDDSDAPLVLHVAAEAMVMALGKADHGREFACLIYTRGFGGTCSLVSEMPGRFRCVPSLPHLKPWSPFDR